MTRGYTNAHYIKAFSFTLTKVYTYKEKELHATASLANDTILNLVYVRKMYHYMVQISESFSSLLSIY
jgi:hypothetical protein